MTELLVRSGRVMSIGARQVWRDTLAYQYRMDFHIAKKGVVWATGWRKR
jgi:hypothetical protein